MASSTHKFSTNLFIILFLFHSLTTGNSTTLTVVNKCSITVSPAIFYGESSIIGFSLPPGETNAVTVPPSWSGSVWGRSHCFNDSDGKLSCHTGDCASSTECNSGNSATLADFKLNVNSSGYDYFSINLVNGYNLPMTVQPKFGKGVGDCVTTGCMIHLNEMCPLERKVMSGGDCIGCRGACQPFSKHCNSDFFAKACPRANINATKTFQSICASTDYEVTFCPSIRKEKNPTKVDNSKGQKKGSNSTINKIVKIILAIVGAGVAACGVIYFACYISYSSRNGWNCGFMAKFIS